jgi:hypothetical protein
VQNKPEVVVSNIPHKMERVPPQGGTMGEFIPLNHMPEMVEKFEMERGHKLGNKKSYKKQMIGINIPWKT